MVYHFRVTVTLTSDLVLIEITMSVRPVSFPVHISYIFFEIGIPNLMCGCILEWRSAGSIFGSL